MNRKNNRTLLIRFIIFYIILALAMTAVFIFLDLKNENPLNKETFIHTFLNSLIIAFGPAFIPYLWFIFQKKNN